MKSSQLTPLTFKLEHPQKFSRHLRALGSFNGMIYHGSAVKHTRRNQEGEKASDIFGPCARDLSQYSAAIGNSSRGEDGSIYPEKKLKRY